ncbi:DUF4861 domain-containing protein [Paraflavitalea sp. CAU 1676]|uniref:DUF4861 domain-containing protein n=1 Tax=Paraflavitalea sp. CAU 1676 TaxID=3032598 RepID=UPI0023DB6AC7|nr:DUF4861 domain-containing protein [Paraflavitalea sp. CAU 1676]MDF2189608.1 DUF4861 domain-containing protein [Paraflavitalea sp. CAU 1676]
MMNCNSLKRSAFAIAIGSFAFLSCNEKRANQLLIENSAIDRPAELIVLKRSELESKVDSLTNGKYVILQNEGRPLVVQYDDLDGDGIWDEAAFLLSLKAGEQKILDVSVSENPATIKAAVLAHVRQRRKSADNTFGDDLAKDSVPAGQPATDFSKEPLPPFLTEGPAWENDKVGFRLYFDVRNGKDIWGKTTSRMVLDEVGVDTTSNYHAKADWGMDILKVGKSLGAGALALLTKDAAGKDTLVRLGGTSMGPIIYQKLADGPVRARFRLQYPSWKALDSTKPITLTEEISIWGGQYFYESKVVVSNAPTGGKLVSGIVNIHSKESKQFDTAGYQVLYTYDAQSENKDNLGMALLVDKKIFDSFITSPNANTDVQNTYGVAFKAGQEPVTFRFYAGWQPSDPQFASDVTFREFLTRETLRSTPVKVSWK